jgi:hypothetical protein
MTPVKRGLRDDPEPNHPHFALGCPALNQILRRCDLLGTIRLCGNWQTASSYRVGGEMPDRSDEFRKLAAECVAIARTTSDPAARVTLLTMAQKCFDQANGRRSTRVRPASRDVAEGETGAGHPTL